ncbi:MAG: MBL fold metallo-hydrolase [Myxococcales bacterium]|nr:MBL fold metallo-hydrolase [Myxococcales bacterium]MCB9520770.1 MBL fold metallo-hydrolase [Myxococcales bacterium]MCB9533487.1 MBL fold metallo-hydrolase [Myxococcales bacterium]
MKLEFLGHAGVRVEFGGTQVVLDAWFCEEGAFDASWFQLPCNHHLAARDWSGIDAAMVSHEHLDHIDPQFLRGLPEETPILVPRYPSPALGHQIHNLSGRSVKRLAPGREHEVGEIRFRIWVEESPMNHDSVWVFKAGGCSFVHTVDSRLTPQQLDEVLEYTGGTVDAVSVQCAGASWFPFAYEDLSPERRHEHSLKKRSHKLSYALQVAEHLKPRFVVINAGPPAFLDPALRPANEDPSFPHAGQSRAWFAEVGYPGAVLAPLPGDSVDLASGAVAEDAQAHADFSWDGVPEYIERYAARMQPVVERVYARADALDAGDIDRRVRDHFSRMLELNTYFLERIDMDVLFDVEGPDGGQWLVSFRSDRPGVAAWDGETPWQYRYRLHSRWLKRILIDEVHWEDFLLSVRFSASRNPDVYNDHLLGILKFNHPSALRAVEQYELGRSDETIEVVAGDGARYEISKFCPHAGASMEHAPIEGRTITCLLHHYTFDLDSGECKTGNCRLQTRRLT